MWSESDCLLGKFRRTNRSIPKKELLVRAYIVCIFAAVKKPLHNRPTEFRNDCYIRPVAGEGEASLLASPTDCEPSPSNSCRTAAGPIGGGCGPPGCSNYFYFCPNSSAVHVGLASLAIACSAVMR